MNESRRTRARPRALALAAAAALWLAAASAQTPKLDTLTDEQLVRLRKVALDKGTSVPLPPALTAVLRLSAAQVGPAVRQVTFQGDDGVKHGFARLNDDSGYFFFRRSPNGVWVFHADKSLSLVIAAHTFSAQQFIALPEGSGHDELAAEMMAWSRVLSPRGVSLPPPGARPPSDSAASARPPSIPGAAPLPGTH